MTIYPAAEIFLLNTFADLHPKLHVSLYANFLQQVPASSRNGYFGKDSKAYVDFLKQKKEPEFMKLIESGMNVERREPYL
jgi:hypothetical protein